MLRIGILIGSTRPQRRSETVARWVYEAACRHQAATDEPIRFELVDIAAYQLPLLDEPTPAAIGDYHNAHTQRWADVIAALDGFVIVTPEYNHGVPAALKNAIDYLFAEWNDKVAGFVSYGLNAGVRAVEQLRLSLAEVKVACVRSQVALSLFTDFEFEDITQPGDCVPAQHHEPVLHRMLDEVFAWSAALKPLHAATAADLQHESVRA